MAALNPEAEGAQKMEAEDTYPITQEVIQRALQVNVEGEALVKVDELKVWKPYDKIAHLCSSVEYGSVKILETRISNLFIKRMVENEKHRSFLRQSRIFDKEVLFFTQLVPQMRKMCSSAQALLPVSLDFIPTCYHADQKSEVLVLENLAVGPKKYYTLPLTSQGHQLNHAMLTMKALATLHAVSHAMAKQMTATSFLQDYPFTSDIVFHEMPPALADKHFFAMALDRISEVLKDDPIHNDKYETLQKLKKKVASIGSVMVNPYEPFNALCHGDVWNNNIMFLLEKNNPVKVKLVDWQMLRYAPVTTDLVQYFYANTNAEFRKQNLVAMLKVYYNAFELMLKLLGLNQVDFTFENLMEDFCNRRLLGFIYFVPTLGNRFTANDEFVDVTDDKIMENYEAMLAAMIQNESVKMNLQKLLLSVYEELEEDIMIWA